MALSRVGHTLSGVNPTEAEEYLQGIGKRLKTKRCTVESHVRYGDGAGGIPDYATQKDTDLIALSTHGRSGIKHWLLGSAAEKLPRPSTKPIFLARCT